MLGIKRNLFGNAPRSETINPRKKPKLNSEIKPQIYPEYTLEGEKLGNFILINGNKYFIEELGAGKFHKVYSFKANQILEIDAQIIDLAKVVLKVVNTITVAPNKHISTLNDDCIAYKTLKKDGVPLPKVYLHPKEFIDTYNINSGNFWLIERLPHPTTPKTPEAIEFVKKWMTLSFQNKRLMISDLKPRNIMMDDQRNCYVVDFDITDHSDLFTLHEEVFEVLFEWAEEKQDQFEYLCSNFNEIDKEILLKLFMERLASS